MDINTDGITAYRTAFISSQHLNHEHANILRAMASNPECWFVHAVASAAENAFILRFKAMSGDHWEDIEDGLKEHGFWPDFIAIIDALAQADFDAVHFDIDFPLLPGAVWYTENNTRVEPLGYELELRTDSRDESFFVLPDGDELWVNEFMRMDKNDEMFSYGFHAQASGSAFHSVVISLSGCGDFVDVARIQ